MPAPFLLSSPTLSPGERLRFLLGHASLPLSVLALTLGTLLWGPYAALAITACAWRCMARHA